MKRIAFLIAIAAMCVSCVKQIDDTHIILVNANNDSWGTVTGGGNYIKGATVTLTATPNGNASFSCWDDGMMNNPRYIKVTGDASYTALFRKTESSATVTFDGYTWPTVIHQGYLFYYTQQAALAGILNSRSDKQMPFACILLYNFHNGTTNLSANQQTGYINNRNTMIEYYKDKAYLSVNNAGDTTYYGDWWCKTATVSISDFDATACTGTVDINATMFSVDDFVETSNVANCATKQMTIHLDNVSFTRR